MIVAVLGCGSIGLRHLRNLRLVGITDLIAHDPDPLALERAGATGARPEPTLQGVWDHRPRAVLVAAPPSTHVDLARAAAARGCDIFIEKPLSHSIDGIVQLASAVSDRGLVGMVACNMRFHRGPATVKRLIDEGRIGRPLYARVRSASYLPSWRPNRDHRATYSASLAEGGAVLDVIHELDLALWYLGDAELIAAAGVGGTSIGIAAECIAELLLRHRGGALSSVHLSFAQRDHRRSCEVVGTEGTIDWEWHGEGVTTQLDGVRSIVPESAEHDTNEMYVREIEAFLDAVRRRVSPPNQLPEALRTLEIAIAARVRARQ